ncbi:MAG: thymidine kinase [Spirochaetales bacterium]|nr:thymidine kinase [Spirochaetales bacterium]
MKPERGTWEGIKLSEIRHDPETLSFLKSLGFPQVSVHHSFTHFDFSRAARRMLVIGPMGSGKTEYSARVWRDSRVALEKSEKVAAKTTTAGADRRRVFFIRSLLDANRFSDYPVDALAYRGGFERLGESIACIQDSFQLEEVVDSHPEAGTWIIDEASFYDERLAYVVRNLSEKRGLNFIFPTLILNFRKDIFNPTAQFILESCTDVYPLTAYCEHSDCILDSFYTYRYYTIDGKECPALYFDPLIVIGGDTKKEDSIEPNYCTRCDEHHYLPGKEYTFLNLKPLGLKASLGDLTPLRNELFSIKNELERSELFKHLDEKYMKGDSPEPINMNTLLTPLIAEKALIYLFAEQNLVTEEQMKSLTSDLDLNKGYMARTLSDNKRPVDFEQIEFSF